MTQLIFYKGGFVTRICSRYFSAVFVAAINIVSFCWYLHISAVLGVHNMVNNPKFDEGGARSKDGKGTVRSKQADFSCGLYVIFRDLYTYRLGVLV